MGSRTRPPYRIEVESWQAETMRAAVPAIQENGALACYGDNRASLPRLMAPEWAENTTRLSRPAF
ncbi:hypothetical protein [Paraburkholderia lacunae]|uniref:hypothetical protein n=1 Tax=Paraburkholderia lacunae TaxID=2211104 RepID=UPI001058B51F|nr:hypothetical protein [Paraburkholderia lacunae]